jgi:pimeloyl-ACP methyl ester carboxylesterase
MRTTLFVAGLLAATLCWAEPKTETGEINGAKFRIDVPANWNGGLVMYCHGYSPVPVGYENPKLSPVLAVFTDAGYAVAQSGYASGGWAIEQAITDTENLRRFFNRKYGAPKETYVTGHSMGGFLTMVLMETQPATYDAGLPLCGPLAASNMFMSKGAFDGRVVFDFYFPGVLPDPSKVPASFQNTKEVQERVLAALDGAPEKAEVLRHRDGFKNNKDMAATLPFITYVLKELQERGGGNPFDNRNTIYSGTPDDNALNAAVKRYPADPKAALYLRTYYTPTGRIAKPMLAVHTSYDPLVPTWIPDTYEYLAEQAGTAANFVQQYVQHDGHCAILPNETAKAFSELREWKSSGVRPKGGELKVDATR